jgi:hypothetical protein
MTRNNCIRTTIVACCVILAKSAPVMAQQEAPQTKSSDGLFIGGYAVAAALHTDKYISDTTARLAIGAGVSARVGWDLPAGITPFIGADFSVVPRKIGRYNFRNIDLGVRVKTPFLKRLTGGGSPYFEGTLTERTIQQNQVRVEGRNYTDPSSPVVGGELPFPEVTSESTAPILSLGAGVIFNRNQRFDLDLGATVNSGPFDFITFAGGHVPNWNFDAKTLRLRAGLVLHLSTTSHNSQSLESSSERAGHLRAG